MKTFIKNLYAMIAVGLVSGSVSAKDIYIAADGNDSNSGLSASSPRATLTSLNDIIEAGDIVHVSGMIDLTKEMDLTDGQVDNKQTWGHWFTDGAGKQSGFYLNGSNNPSNSPWKNITFVGEDPAKDGFDGKEKTRHFYVRGDNKNTTVTFKNLSLINGLSPMEGAGSIFIHDNGFVEIDNCVFDNNHTDFAPLYVADGETSIKGTNSERGGAINMQTGHLTISNSTFTNNIARRGGAFCVTGGQVKVTNTNFTGNGGANIPGFDSYLLDNTRGGAVCLWPLNVELHASFDHCNFIENSVWNMGGAMLLHSNSAGCNLLDVVVTNSAFIGNESVNGQAGAIMFHNEANMGNSDDKCKNIIFTIANSSIFENKAKVEGGAIYLNGGLKGDVLRMVNCTMANNITSGNAGHGGGLTEKENNETFTPDNVDRYFYNCLFEHNTAPTASNGAGEYADFTTKLGYQYSHNTHIGRVVGQGISQEDFFAALNNGEGSETFTFNTSVGNIGDEENTFIIPDENLNYYQFSYGNLPFINLNEGSEALTRGDVAYLKMDPYKVKSTSGKEFNVQGYDISATDQAGFKRPEGSCTIGAMEATLEDMVDDSTGDSYFNGKPLPYIEDNEQAGITSPVISGEGNVCDINVTNNVITATGAIIELYNISGGKIATSTETINISQLASGLYIVRASVGGASKSIKIAK